MDNTMLTLKPGAVPAERGGQSGLLLGGRFRGAQGAPQAALLKALAGGGQTLARLNELLLAQGLPGGETGAALELAAFILNFEDYLEP